MVVCLLIASLLISPHFAAAIDMIRVQAVFNRMGGKPQLLLDWQKLLIEGRDLPISEKLKMVNHFFNRKIEFATDQAVWEQNDHWATPMELLSKGSGDCEDYVIGKYFALLSLDVTIDKLRLIYVKAQVEESSGMRIQAHMVLAYYPSPYVEPLLLDNLIMDIVPASRRPDLQPVFSFNHRGIFNGVNAENNPGRGGVGRYTRWQDLLQRARDEGFD